MAKKPKSRKSKSAPPPFDPNELGSLPDRRVLEGILAKIGMGLGAEPGDSKLAQAQEVMYTAFDERSPQKQIRLAKKALEISLDCADAYVLLSEHATSVNEVFELLQKGVAAGERALGERTFQEHAGHFWGLLETRPYMRARASLMQCLWTLGKRTDAIEHAYELLRLNPNDNQGIRYTLAAYLLDLNRNDEVGRLQAQYEDDYRANWPFNRALVEFRESGDSPAAKEALLHACERNRHVTDYILGLKTLPEEPPGYISPGQESEAIEYTVEHLSCWKGTPGALAWLRKTLKAPLPDMPPRSLPPWPRLAKALAGLPQEAGEIWQVDVRPLAAVVNSSSQQGTPWMVIVTNPAEDAILAFEMEESRPDAKQVWEHVVVAMLQPKDGEPHRPAGLQVRLKSLCTAWRKKLAEVRVECETCAELDHVEEVLRETISPLASDGSEIPAAAESNVDPCDLVQYSGRAWQADIRRLPVWVGDEGEPRRPWSVLVADRDTSAVLAQDISSNAPTPEWLADNVLKAMRQPSVGEPYRPGVVQVTSREYAGALESRLSAAGVEIEVCPELAEIDDIFSSLTSHLAGSDKMAPLLEVPGVGLQQVAGYFTAAAEFYQQAPWRLIPGDAPIKIECSKYQSGPWYAVVMGQSAMMFGLALYEGPDVLREVLHNGFSQQGAARNTSALTVTYGEEFEIAIRDLEAIEQHGWPVAAPEAYPSLVRVNPGLVVRPPLGWELELTEGCLRAIPTFLEKPDQQTARLQVKVASGDLELVLSRVEV